MIRERERACLPLSLLTLTFNESNIINQVMTLESWSMGIVRVVMEDFPYASILFITWIVIMSIGVLNLLAAVFVNSYMHCSHNVASEIRNQGSDSNVTKIQELKQMLHCDEDNYLSQGDFIERVQTSYEVASTLQVRHASNVICTMD